MFGTSTFVTEDLAYTQVQKLFSPMQITIPLAVTGPPGASTVVAVSLPHSPLATPLGELWLDPSPGGIVAAAMGVVYQTSYVGLVERARTKASDTVLVHAAAGGVGLAAVQIAKALGCTVIGTAGSDEKLELARSEGADHAFTYRDDSWVERVRELTEGRGVDVVYDPVGGDAFDLSTKVLAWEARLLVVGFASGRIPSVAANRILLKNVDIVGVHWGPYFDHRPSVCRDAQDALNALWADGKVRPLVSETHPLREAKAALAKLAARKTTGKVVLHP